jgi:hypothetical protein
MIRLLAVVSLVIVGCAAAPREGPTNPPGPTTTELQELEKDYVDLRRFDSQLQTVDSTAAATPYCVQVIQLRDSICALAARICQIASRDRSPTIATERCTDGKTRCQAAIDRTRTRGCETVGSPPERR